LKLVQIGWLRDHPVGLGWLDRQMKNEMAADIKNPAPAERGLPLDRWPDYLFVRLAALSGLILVWTEPTVLVTCVARLQFPFFHLIEGSGHAVQYQPDANSPPRLHPLHCSTI